MATPVKFDKKFEFVVEIEGIARAGLKTCSEFAVEFEKVVHREGKRAHPHQAPGNVTYPDITMERGMADDYDFYNWMIDCYNAAAGTGQPEPTLFRNVDIVQLDRDGEELARYTVYDAFIQRYSAGDWDKDASEVKIESIVIAYDHWKKAKVA